MLDWFKQYKSMASCSLLPSAASTRLPPSRAATAPSLIFNAHLDTGPSCRNASADAKKLETAWVEGDMLFGKGMINDKAQLCAFMIAMSALKRAGVQLKGDSDAHCGCLRDRQSLSG